MRSAKFSVYKSIGQALQRNRSINRALRPSNSIAIPISNELRLLRLVVESEVENALG